MEDGGEIRVLDLAAGDNSQMTKCTTEARSGSRGAKAGMRHGRPQSHGGAPPARPHLDPSLEGGGVPVGRACARVRAWEMVRESIGAPGQAPPRSESRGGWGTRRSRVRACARVGDGAGVDRSGPRPGPTSIRVSRGVGYPSVARARVCARGRWCGSRSVRAGQCRAERRPGDNHRTGDHRLRR